ncbi:hypothetical protein Tco_0517094 [Tanacetum coccineum]
MDNPNITTKEYIRLEEEKARRHGKVYNWETATYGKIWYDEDVHDLRYVETEFLAITFNDKLTSEEALSCEPTVSPLNDNEIDFRISFDESNDEDYTPKVSYFDDLDFLKDFDNEFPTIIYNDALMSKSDFSTEPVEISHRIDEFNLKTETTLPEHDEKEQNILYFNDLFPFNIIYPDDLKLEKDNDDEIDIIKSSGGKLRRPRFGEVVVDLDTAGALQFYLGEVRHRMSWRKFILALGLHITKEMETDGLIACSIAGSSQAPEKVTVTDLFYLRGMDVGSVNFPYLLASLSILDAYEERLWGITDDLRDPLVIDLVSWREALIFDEVARDDDPTTYAGSSVPHSAPQEYVTRIEKARGGGS